jgi:hypothetical protein
MPALKRDETGVDIPAIAIEKPAMGLPVASQPDIAAPIESVSALPNLLDMDLLMDPTPVQVSATQGTQPPPVTSTDFMDIFIPSSDPIAQTSEPILNLFDSAPAADLEFDEFHSASPSTLDIAVHEDENVKIDFSCNKTDLDNPQITSIDAKIFNKGAVLVTDFNMQAAVPKHLKLQLSSASGSVM